MAVREASSRQALTSIALHADARILNIQYFQHADHNLTQYMEHATCEHSNAAMRLQLAPVCLEPCCRTTGQQR